MRKGDNVLECTECRLSGRTSHSAGCVVLNSAKERKQREAVIQSSRTKSNLRLKI